MHTIDKVKSALRRLELSDNEQAIYLSLLTKGATTVRVLASRTGITRPSVYDQLKTLRELNLVVELEIEGKTHFAAADIKNLSALLDDKIDRLEQSRTFLEEALPSLRDTFNTVEPKVRFFEGKEGVKQLLKDIMWHDNTTVQLYWPYREMSALFDTTFIAWFDTRRAARTLTIESLWPHDSQKSDMSLFQTLAGDTQKKLPSSSTPEMAYSIYDQKVAFISSPAEAFGFIVESAEFATLQRLQFAQLWKVAK